jgi:hypothetical protein
MKKVENFRKEKKNLYFFTHMMHHINEKNKTSLDLHNHFAN